MRLKEGITPVDNRTHRKRPTVEKGNRRPAAWAITHLPVPTNFPGVNGNGAHHEADVEPPRPPVTRKQLRRAVDRLSLPKGVQRTLLVLIRRSRRAADGSVSVSATQAEIARETDVDERSVRNHVRALVERGLLSVESHWKRRARLPNVYVFNLEALGVYGASPRQQPRYTQQPENSECQQEESLENPAIPNNRKFFRLSDEGFSLLTDLVVSTGGGGGLSKEPCLKVDVEEAGSSTHSVVDLSRDVSTEAPSSTRKGRGVRGETRSTQETLFGEPPPPRPQAPSRAEAEALALFDAFWRVYPRKQAKKAALARWKKLAAEGVDLPAVTEAAKRFRDDPNREPEFTPHPTTWLNQGRWEDDPLPERRSRAGASRGPIPPPETWQRPKEPQARIFGGNRTMTGTAKEVPRQEGA